MKRIPLPEGFPLGIRSGGYEGTVRFYPDDGYTDRVALENLRDWFSRGVEFCDKALAEEGEA